MRNRQSKRLASRRQLAKLAREAGIDRSGNLSSEQCAILLQLAAAGRLTLEQINQLMDAYPDLVHTCPYPDQGLRQIASGVQASQQRALQAAEQVLVAPWDPNCAFAEAARNAESDDARLEIAEMAWGMGQQFLEGTSMIERMNRDNNNLWRWMVGAAAVAGVAAVAVVGLFLLADGGESPD